MALPKKTLARLETFIAGYEWTFAKTMPQWPHWYVVRDLVDSEEFDFFAGVIQKYGYDDPWKGYVRRFLVVGGLKYWVDDDGLNRAEPLSNEEVIRRGEVRSICGPTRGLRGGFQVGSRQYSRLRVTSGHHPSSPNPYTTSVLLIATHGIHYRSSNNIQVGGDARQTSFQATAQETLPAREEVLEVPQDWKGPKV